MQKDRKTPRERYDDARTVKPGAAVTYHNERQAIPAVKPAVSDLEALEHARSCVRHVANADGPPPPLTSRALSELDRLIHQARQGGGS